MERLDHPLPETEKFARLRLWRTHGIGPTTFNQILGRFGSAVDAIDALPALNFRGRKLSLFPADAAEQEVAEMERRGVTLLAPLEAAYPTPLASIPDAPPLIAVLGETSLLRRQSIAIVGARNASATGRRMATMLARDLGTAGYSITSGLARGIDGAAHAGALDTGTIAVLAGGVDQVYPPEHRALYQEIAGRGAIVSEMPMGHVAKARDFPKRNRIVSGLTMGVVVVEAAERSGTLITARLAGEQGRDVFAVPGSPLDPRSAGTNRLIRDGACLIRDANDVLDALGPTALRDDQERTMAFSPPPPLEHPSDGGADAALVRAAEELLSPTPIHRDELVRHLNASPGQVADALLDLVLSGSAIEASAGMFALGPASISDK